MNYTVLNVRERNSKISRENGFLILISIIFLVFTTMSSPIEAEQKIAPEWDVSEWINGNGTTLADLKGSVVVVEFFQLWCPGCNRFSIPLMERWHQVFAEDIDSERLVMVSIHTVFEGHEHQNPARLKAFLEEKGITHLVGIDRHKDGDEIPETMKRYNTRGTPEMAFIDKQGRLKFQHFGGFNVDRAEQYLRQLLDESS